MKFLQPIGDCPEAAALFGVLLEALRARYSGRVLYPYIVAEMEHFGRGCLAQEVHLCSGYTFHVERLHDDGRLLMLTLERDDGGRLYAYVG